VTEAKLESAAALPFALAGNAKFTLRSVKTGTRYTYKVRRAEEKEGQTHPRWFVSLLTGSDNDADFTYMGMIDEGLTFRLTKSSKLAATSTPVAAFDWFFKRLAAKRVTPDGVEVWHAGRCGRCGRTLTVPESIEQGFGPECAGRVA